MIDDYNTSFNEIKYINYFYTICTVFEEDRLLETWKNIRFSPAIM